jgi:hypothetical protein
VGQLTETYAVLVLNEPAKRGRVPTHVAVVFDGRPDCSIGDIFLIPSVIPNIVEGRNLMGQLGNYAIPVSPVLATVKHCTDLPFFRD